MKQTPEEAFADVAQFRTGKFAGSSIEYLAKLQHELLCFCDDISEEVFSKQERRDAAADAADEEVEYQIDRAQERRHFGDDDSMGEAWNERER